MAPIESPLESPHESPHESSRESPHELRPLVLVTGASGFVAIHCVQRLLAAGYRVRGTVRSLDDRAKVQPLRALPGAAERLELVVADLLDKHAWMPAIAGCAHVLHVASPWPIVADESTVEVAVSGTLNVLRAVAADGNVERCILTSSCAAINDGHRNDSRVFDERCWTDLESKRVEHYARSKTLAEREAWAFWKSLPTTGRRFDLVVLAPTFIVGPVLSAVPHGSATIIGRMLSISTFIAAPRVCLGVVDVGDVARAHVLALSAPNVAGERILVSGESVWFADMRNYLAHEFKRHGYLISPLTAPNFLVRIYAKLGIDTQSAAIIHRLGPAIQFDNSKSKRLLGLVYSDIRASIVQMAYSMMERDMVAARTPLGCRVAECSLHAKKAKIAIKR